MSDDLGKILIAMSAGTGALLLGESRPWVHEPWEHHDRRMIGRKFAEWLDAQHPGASAVPCSATFSLEDLETAFRAGYDTPECW